MESGRVLNTWVEPPRGHLPARIQCPQPKPQGQDAAQARKNDLALQGGWRTLLQTGLRDHKGLVCDRLSSANSCLSAFAAFSLCNQKRGRIESKNMYPDPLAWWHSEFGEVAPRGHLLRRHLTAQWVRFHSLPDSKRYAASLDEYAEIQHRHLLIASAIFRADEPLYVFRAHSDEVKLRGKGRHQLAGRQFREAVAVMPYESLGQDDEDRMYVRALVSKWKPDFFEAVIRLLADWEEVGISFVSPSTKNVFCPYDGGMDIFTFSISPEELRARFSGWLSTHPDGL